VQVSVCVTAARATYFLDLPGRVRGAAVVVVVGATVVAVVVVVTDVAVDAKSNLFGEPAPAPMTTPVVDASRMADPTCDGVADGLSERYRATTPATCGLAIEVPLSVAVAVVLV
jgi:hypothetical protein